MTTPEQLRRLLRSMRQRSPWLWLVAVLAALALLWRVARPPLAPKRVLSEPAPSAPRAAPPCPPRTLPDNGACVPAPAPR